MAYGCIQIPGRKRTHIRIAFLSTLLLFGCLFATNVWGQASRGTVVGTVTDSTGAVVPNAAVTVTNMGTKASMHTTTTNAGEFTVPYLSPAVYSVTVEGLGFEKAEVRGLSLAIGQILRVNLTLKPGSTNVTVTVPSAPSSIALDTDSAAVSQQISEKLVLDLPLENRSFNNLLLLAPGATTTIVNNINSGTQPSSVLNIGGARGTSTGYLIDGMTNTDPWWDEPEIKLSIDAIQEFKEQASVYSAQYGDSAVQVSATVKSGTNQLHGTVYEFIRNDAFDSQPYNFTGSPIPVSKLRQNQYGFSLGGPVYIPKIYNGRDKTFFFANFERLKSVTGGEGQALAPNANLAQGIVASTTPIINPATGTAFATNADGNYVIPSSDWSRMATVILTAPAGSYYPKPTGSYDNGLYNALYFSGGTDAFNQQSYRIDQRIGSKDNLSARFTLTNDTSAAGGYDLYGGSSGNINNQSWNVIETHAFTNNLVNLARVGWISYSNGTAGQAAPTADLNALGFTNTFPLAGLPLPNIQLLTGGLACCGGAFDPNVILRPTTWNGEDSVSWIHGRHAFSFGFLAVLNYVVQNGLDLEGNFDFDGSKTANGNTPTQGTAWTDFLLGFPSEGQISIPTGYSQLHPINPNLFVDNKKFAGYVNDDWKVKSNLTVNLGLRYDFQSNPVEENHRQFWRNTAIPAGALCSPDKTLVSTINASDSAANPSSPQLYYNCSRSTPKKPFGPRLGFAFRPFPDNKTVVRGGFGIFLDQYSLYEFASGNIAPYIGTFNANGYNTNNLYPSEALPVVTSADLGSLTNLEPPVMHQPYYEEWSLSAERELLPNSKLTVNYVGSEGHHLETRLASSQPTSYDPSNPGAGYAFQNFGTYGQNGTAFSPGFVLEGAFPGSSNYNSLQASVDHRSKDLALLVAYTWSSAMDDTSSSGGAGLENKEWSGPMDAHNIHLDYGKSAFDVNHRFVASFVYSLPVGRGQRFGSGVNKAVDNLIGGWQVNGIYSEQSGLPFNPTCTDIGFVLQAYGQRCNRVGNPYPAGFHKSIQHYFDANAYAQPAIGVFGTGHHDDLRSYGLNNLDASIFKNFSLYGDNRVRFQFRVEAFNVLNHPQMGQPDQGYSDGNPVPGQPYGSTFTTVSSTFSAPRVVQLAGKIIF